MFKVIDSLLSELRPCFSREASFAWFVIIVVGLIVRFDHYGATSFIRWLFLDPQCYGLMLRFFRTSSWSVRVLMERWSRAVINRYPVVEIEGRVLQIGDTIKVGKEARKMPGVKKLHQESDDNAKPEWIRGHHFAFIGLLAGSLAKTFCIPIEGRITEGVGDLLGESPSDTIISRMVRLAILKATQIGRLCYLVVDAYFAVGPAFLLLKAARNGKGEQLVHLITRAKENYVGFYDRGEKRYREKDKVRLIDVCDFPRLFEKAQVMIKGELKTISYCCVDLIWQPVDGLIRFVCVLDGKERYILMSSDLTLSGSQIIAIYGYRVRIEAMFLALKHLLGGFCYHFWTKSFPALKKGAKLDAVKLDEGARKKLAQAVDAIEKFVNLAAIALGLLDYISLTHKDRIWNLYQGWLRTFSSDYPSEGVVQSVLRSEFFTSLGGASATRKVPSSRTLRLILEKGRPSRNESELEDVA